MASEQVEPDQERTVPPAPEGMVRPAPDPAQLLASWMEWEKGDSTPGRVMADLKKGGMRDVLEALAAPGESGTA